MENYFLGKMSHGVLIDSVLSFLDETKFFKLVLKGSGTGVLAWSLFFRFLYFIFSFCLRFELLDALFEKSS